MERFGIEKYVVALEQRIPKWKKPKEKKEALPLESKPDKHPETEKIVTDYLWIRAWR